MWTRYERGKSVFQAIRPNEADDEGNEQHAFNAQNGKKNVKYDLRQF